MTTMIPLAADGSQIVWGEACASGTAEYQSGTVRDVAPNAVLWLSTWETSDAIANGGTVRFGTRVGDEALLRELEAARARLGIDGAKLVLMTVPPPADTSEVKPLRADEGTRRDHLNHLFREFAAQHPDTVTVADLASIVCPKATCPATVDGVVLRPRDGNHFEGGGPAWVAPRLYAEVIRALSAVPSTSPSPTPQTTLAP